MNTTLAFKALVILLTLFPFLCSKPATSPLRNPVDILLYTPYSLFFRINPLMTFTKMITTTTSKPVPPPTLL